VIYREKPSREVLSLRTHSRRNNDEAACSKQGREGREWGRARLGPSKEPRALCLGRARREKQKRKDHNERYAHPTLNEKEEKRSEDRQGGGAKASTSRGFPSKRSRGKVTRTNATGRGRKNPIKQRTEKKRNRRPPHEKVR